MIKKSLVAGAVGLAALSAAALFYFNSDRATSARAFISPADQVLVSHGKDIYVSHCAVCHGANLEGQPEWRERRPNGRLPAPPHDETGHTWHHPDAVLIDIIQNGLVPGRTAPKGYESDMPAYRQALSDTDITAVLAYIKSTWPSEILARQKEMTMQHNQR
jgi:S-disulfanyl-L-cysteine oxidoreductase SoxD